MHPSMLRYTDLNHPIDWSQITMPTPETCYAHDDRLRILEQSLASELGESRAFRADLRNWRAACDNQNAIFQQELLRQSERVGRLEQYQARHEAEYKAKMEQIGELAQIEKQISERLGTMDEKLLGRVESLEHKVNALIIEKAVAKWLVGVIAAGGTVVLQIALKKIGLL